MEIIINAYENIPIYEQITRQIEAQILSGRLAPETPLPSIRALASDLKVSVITTKKTYEELERRGYIVTVPQKGSYVARLSAETLKARVRGEISRRGRDLLDYAARFGIGKEECMKILEDGNKQ